MEDYNWKRMKNGFPLFFSLLFFFFYIKKKEGSNFKEELKDIKHIFKEASQRLLFFKG